MQKIQNRYLATWHDSIEEADKINEYGMNGWVHWNGVSMTDPTFVKYNGKIYTYIQFKKEVWKIN